MSESVKGDIKDIKKKMVKPIIDLSFSVSAYKMLCDTANHFNEKIEPEDMIFKTVKLLAKIKRLQNEEDRKTRISLKKTAKKMLDEVLEEIEKF